LQNDEDSSEKIFIQMKKRKKMTCNFIIDPLKSLPVNLANSINGDNGNNIKSIIKRCKRAFGKKITRLINIKLIRT